MIDTFLNPASSDAGSGLSVRNATVTYRNGHTALRDATFKIPAGTITALVGVNGSGKSTLFKAIMGFVGLAGGEITILGQRRWRRRSAILWPTSPSPRTSTGTSRFSSRTW